MDADTYQEQAARTLIDDDQVHAVGGHDMRLLWNVLGLAGEAGEAANLVKKGILHQHGLDVAALTKELGDCCWYIAALCSVLGVPFSAILEANIEKLKLRYPQGWDTECSKNRVDVPKPALVFCNYRCPWCGHQEDATEYQPNHRCSHCHWTQMDPVYK